MLSMTSSSPSSKVILWSPPASFSCPPTRDSGTWHPLLLEDLAETLLAVGDFPACRHVATLIATLDPRHARAEQMKRRAETLELAAGFDWNAKEGPVDEDDAEASRIVRVSAMFSASSSTSGCSVTCVL